MAIAATQPACVEEIRERCPLVTDPRPAPALPHDFVQLDDLLRHRAFQMVHDARQLHGSATTSFHIVFGNETLPLWCDQMVLARDLAMRGRLREAGRKYQALLVLSQLMELALAVHATVEYADSVGELSLTLSRTTETFGNQMEPLLAAALSEDPQRIERALRQGAPALVAWRDYLVRWTAHIRADAERMKVAKAAWDITIGVIAAYETAGALAELAASGGPPIMPLPALAGVGGGAAAMELSGAAYVELAESIRRLIASGALDAGVVVALSAGIAQMSSPVFPPATVEEVVSSSRRPSKGGQLSEGARAIAKKLGHAQPGRHDSAFAGLTPTQANAETVIRDILQKPVRTFQGDRVIDVYNASGQGVRFDRSTNAFIGFLEEGLATQ